MKDNKNVFYCLSDLFNEKINENYKIFVGTRNEGKSIESKIIMLKWLKSVLEVYETGGTYNQYAIRIKENFADPQGALKVIKEWLDEGKS